MAVSKKNVDKKDKVLFAKQNEKIINDLLLQFAYTLTICVLTIFVFNATGAYKYGQAAYDATRNTMWVLFGLFIISGIVFAVMYKNNKKGVLKTTSVYSFITAFVMFWYVGVEKIPYYLQNYIPFMSNFTGTYRVIFAMFPILGIAVVVEFAVYFCRYYSLASAKKKR